MATVLPLSDESCVIVYVFSVNDVPKIQHLIQKGEPLLKLLT